MKKSLTPCELGYWFSLGSGSNWLILTKIGKWEPGENLKFLSKKSDFDEKSGSGLFRRTKKYKIVYPAVIYPRRPSLCRKILIVSLSSFFLQKFCNFLSENTFFGGEWFRLVLITSLTAHALRKKNTEPIKSQELNRSPLSSNQNALLVIFNCLRLKIYLMNWKIIIFYLMLIFNII